MISATAEQIARYVTLFEVKTAVLCPPLNPETKERQVAPQPFAHPLRLRIKGRQISQATT
ncbi:MAG: hypothetical protein ABSH48_22530 [Verrucomicrobiota bacterium]